MRVDSGSRLPIYLGIGVGLERCDHIVKLSIDADGQPSTKDAKFGFINEFILVDGDITAEMESHQDRQRVSLFDGIDEDDDDDDDGDEDEDAMKGASEIIRKARSNISRWNRECDE